MNGRTKVKHSAPTQRAGGKKTGKRVDKESSRDGIYRKRKNGEGEFRFSK